MSIRIHPLPLLALVLACVVSATAPLSGQTLNKHGKPFPAIALLQHAKGPNIPAALGHQSHDVADWYDQTDAEFNALCNRDKSLKADKQARLHYACAAPVAQQGSSAAWGNGGPSLPAPFPDSQTFLLHSKPGASKVIYLDFDGNVTSGTAWNTSYTNGANIVTPAYDIDGNRSSFSTAELANIQLIWQSVAEDFSPFDVDVTTQDPGVEALRKTSPSDGYYGKRVCIGGSSFDWTGMSAGGLAYIGSFDWNVDAPAFVFPAQLGSGNPKFVAEAVAHEVGHTLGLHHDGLAGGTEYYTGQGNWAPIMGASYYKDVTQWCKGEYNNANNQEDQLALILGMLSPRQDVVGNDMNQPTLLNVSGGSMSASGLIEQASDVDVYKFSTGQGDISLFARAAAPVSGNVNLLFSLYDSSGALLSTAGPSAAAVGVNLSASVAEGVYYVAVNNVGSGDPLTTGFSSYGGIGQYSLNGSVVPVDNKPPVASAASSAPLAGVAALTVSFSSAGSADPDGAITSYHWDFGDGATSTGPNPSHTYTSEGTFTASLVVQDNYGRDSDASSVTVTVNPNQKPVAVAANSAPLTGVARVSVNFSSAGSSDADGSVGAWQWTFGDGGTSTLANPSHLYTLPGTYVATLIVRDDHGLYSDPVAVNVTVVPNQRPVAVAVNSSPLSGAAPLTVNFSSAGSSDADGGIVAWKWTFGDGGTSTLANPTHTYLAVGTYTATLTVTDNLGLASTPVTLTVTAKANQKPVAVSSFTVATSMLAPATINFSSAGTYDSDGSVASYSWIFGDRTTSTLANPSHVYAKAGTYIVSLIVKDNFGLASVASYQTVKVTNPPLHVDSITITTTTSSRGTYATALVKVRDQFGVLKSSATVTGVWSGLTSSTISAKTAGTGVAAAKSATTLVKGTFTYTVTGITLTGYPYDASQNLQSTISIAAP